MRMHKELFLTLVLAFLHSTSCSIPRSEVNFDYYVFAQQWPESVCLQAYHTHQHNCSISSNTTAWTVHGLWPSLFNDSMAPVNCKSSVQFNVSLLEDFMSDMKSRWPNLYTDEELTSFWSHEWYKHGTCALAAGAVKNEAEYFKKALDINTALDILNKLRDRKVPPVEDFSYLYDDFVSAVSDIVGGKTVYLECFRKKHQRGSDILQLEICLDKNFQPINCKHLHHSNCADFPVIYPPIHHPY